MDTIEYGFGTGAGPATVWHSAADLDIDGDGHPDAVALDFDGDGRVDDALWDTDGDGIADTAMLDLDDDGSAEQYFSDPSGDGTWNRHLDGRPAPHAPSPVVVVADGGDGRPAVLVDTDRDGRLDVRLQDTDGDGHLDRIEPIR